MALKNLLVDRTSLDETQAEDVQNVIVAFLKEDAIRGEVYDSARFQPSASESFSIVDVHNVLDALIESLEDTQ